MWRSAGRRIRMPYLRYPPATYDAVTGFLLRRMYRL